MTNVLGQTAGTATAQPGLAASTSPSDREQLAAMISSNGHGHTLADRLLSRFGSVAAIAKAHPADLTIVEGIGQATADDPSRRCKGERIMSGQLGTMLVRLRQAKGYTQLGVAERLGAASGVATITLKEVSQWERQEGIPSTFWLSWLAVVQDTPVEKMEAAVRRSR
jgi:DNA-binding transcriptional regulator YiaG